VSLYIYTLRKVVRIETFKDGQICSGPGCRSHPDRAGPLLYGDFHRQCHKLSKIDQTHIFITGDDGQRLIVIADKLAITVLTLRLLPTTASE
jgi:hypothetical protein